MGNPRHIAVVRINVQLARRGAAEMPPGGLERGGSKYGWKLVLLQDEDTQIMAAEVDAAHSLAASHATNAGNRTRRNGTAISGLRWLGSGLDTFVIF